MKRGSDDDEVKVERKKQAREKNMKEADKLFGPGLPAINGAKG